MSIQGGGSGRSVFLRRQQLLQFRKLGSPRRFVRVKGICQTTPANIAGQYLLLLRRGLPGGLLQMLQQLDRRDIGLVLGLGAALAQMVVTDMEILGVAAQVVFVLLVGRLLSRPLVGKGLPIAVDRDGDRVFRLLARLCVRGGGRFGRRGFRPVNVQPFHHHVIGKMVLLTGINGHRLSVKGRCLSCRFLDSLGGFSKFFNGDSGFNSRFGLFLSKAIQLTGVHPAQDGCDLIPAEEQHSQPLLVCIQHFQLDAFRHGAVVGGVAGLQLHRLDDVGISPTQPLGNFSVGLAAAQQLGNLRLIRRTDQAVGQHVPQVLVCGIRVDGQKLGDGLVAGILAQQRLKPFPTFGPEDWVSHAGRKKLYGIRPQFCDLVFLIFQIDRISLMVDRRGWVIDLFLRDSLLNGLVFFIGNGNVDLMGRLPVPDGDGVSLAGDGLAG